MVIRWRYSPTAVINIVGLIVGLFWFGPWFLVPAILVGIRVNE